jgi:hypothetical protein
MLHGFRSGTGQIGRQYNPVVRTPAKNCPSKRGSRLRHACQQMLGSRTPGSCGSTEASVDSATS